MDLDELLDRLSSSTVDLIKAAALPTQFSVRLDHVEESEWMTHVCGQTCARGESWSNPAAVGFFDVATDLATGELWINTLDVPRLRQGRKYGRTCIEALAQVGLDARCEEMLLEAEKDGRYAWARCGFAFRDDDDRERVVCAAAGLAADLGIELDADAIERPSDLSDLPGTVSSAKLLALGVRPAFKGEEVPLGRALLLGPGFNHWWGSIALREDDPGYVRLKQYVLYP